MNYYENIQCKRVKATRENFEAHQKWASHRKHQNHLLLFVNSSYTLTISLSYTNLINRIYGFDMILGHLFLYPVSHDSFGHSFVSCAFFLSFSVLQNPIRFYLLSKWAISYRVNDHISDRDCKIYFNQVQKTSDFHIKWQFSINFCYLSRWTVKNPGKVKTLGLMLMNSLHLHICKQTQLYERW